MVCMALEMAERFLCWSEGRGLDIVDLVSMIVG